MLLVGTTRACIKAAEAKSSGPRKAPAAPRAGRRAPAREVTAPFVLLADCEVYYDGRGRSALRRGHYLLIRKDDGSFLVHGARLITPLNYQPARSPLYRPPEGYLCRGRHESIRVVLHRELVRMDPRRWDDHPIEIARTERQLADRLARRIARDIPGVIEVFREFPTPCGAVDIVAIDAEGTHHVVEVKRSRATIHAGVLLGKYLEALAERGLDVRGYIAAPTIAETARAYCQKRGYTYLDIPHAPGRLARAPGPTKPRRRAAARAR